MQNALVALKNAPHTLLLLLLSVCFPVTILAQANEPQVTFSKTAAGYYWPLGSGDFLKTRAEGNCGTWLGRDSAHGGCYFDGVYHIGFDMFFSRDDSLFGHAVYAIATGKVVYISKNGWGDGNVGVFVRHTYKDPFSGAETDFLALYGHVLETVAVGEIVTGGVQFTTIGHYPGADHLHFGIVSPIISIPAPSPYGMMPNSSWPTGSQANQNGFVDPVAFITNQSTPPKCMNGSSERYRPGGNLPFHPDGTIVKVRQKSTDFPHPETVYVLRGNKRYRIPSQFRLNRLYGEGRGFDFRDVITVSPQELKRYSDAGTLLTQLPDNGKSEPTGRLIRQWGGTEVSIVTRYAFEGVRLPFSSGSNFLNLGYAECNIAGSSDYWNGYVIAQGKTVENIDEPSYTIQAEVEPIFSATAAAIPNPPQVGQETGIGVTVLNADRGNYIAGSANDRIIDIEIYNSSGAKVFQYFFENQFLTKDEPETYEIRWTPTTAGTYTVKAAVFSSDWSYCDYWNDSALTLNVGGSSPPPQGGQIDIWWPSDGASVSGTQPFKALLQNYSLSQYTLYWQVDGGGLVQMYDSSVDYPHKEAMVDLSGWNWRGTGPYTVNFVAKDGSGNVLAQKSVTITVSQ